jgi:hypothetical protein
MNVKLSLAVAIAAAIGSNTIARTVWQLTPTGMEKVEEIRGESFAPVAYAQGRQVPNAAQIQQYIVGVAGQQDVIWDPLYDSIAYPAAGSLQFSFYSNPVGQGTSSAPGAGAVSKSIFDTNLTIGNQLTSGNAFLMVGSENLFFPGVNNSTTPTVAFGIEPGTANTPATVGNFVNDVYNVGNGGNKIMTVGTDRQYITDGPLNIFPPATRLAVAVAVANQDSTTTGAGTEISYAAWSGEIYNIAPIFIQSNQNWTMVVSFAGLIPTPSGKIGRLVDRMRGYLIRQAT